MHRSGCGSRGTTGTRWTRLLWPPAGAVVLAVWAARPVDGQTIRGTVYEADSVRAVPGASVRLLEGEEDQVLRTALTDNLGAFELQAPGPGWFRLGVEVFGYAPTETSDFFIAASDSLTLEIRVEYSAIPLDPLVVSVFNENRADFERRKDLSYGTRLGPDILAERGDMTLNEFAAWRVPWLSWRSFKGLYTLDPFGWKGGRGCSPMIFIDGRYFRTAPGIRPDLDRWLDPDDVKAIEVYPTGSLLPSPFFGLARQENRGEAPCGLIAVWTTLGFGGDGVPEGR